MVSTRRRKSGERRAAQIQKEDYEDAIDKFHRERSKKQGDYSISSEEGMSESESEEEEEVLGLDSDEGSEESEGSDLDSEDEIEKAGKEQKELMIVPVAFVSEHSETLVELDIEYKVIADKHSMNYVRVPTLSVNSRFIDSLKDIVVSASNSGSGFLYSDEMKRLCPTSYSKCPCKN